MAKQVRKPASTSKHKGEGRVSDDRNTVKGAGGPKTEHPRSDANNSYNPKRISPTKRG